MSGSPIECGCTAMNCECKPAPASNADLADRIYSEIEYLGDWQTLAISLSGREWDLVIAALRASPRQETGQQENNT